MVIHEQIPQPGLKSHKDKTRGSAPRIALPLRPLREAFIFVSIRGLELLFYFHVEVPPKGVGGGGIETVAVVDKWRVGIEDVVNAEG